MNFFGFSVPYWYYKTGNNIIVEQVPSKNHMEEQLDNYIYERAGECNFREFSLQGFDVSMGDVENVGTSIRSNEVNVEVSVEVFIEGCVEVCIEACVEVSIEVSV